MDYSALARESLDRVAAAKPLVHQITNIVVANDSANLTLGFGALPVMAYAPQEVAEMAAIAQALVLNIGTLSEEEIASMLIAGKAAGEKGIPIVLDPVGAGATTFRTESALRLLRELPITVLRGNRGEIGALVGSGEVRGVEATGSALAAIWVSDSCPIHRWGAGSWRARSGAARSCPPMIGGTMIRGGAKRISPPISKWSRPSNGWPRRAG